MLGDGLGPEAPLRGVVALREGLGFPLVPSIIHLNNTKTKCVGNGRYFMPQNSGKSHDYRQEVLHREGLLKDRSCSLLEIGKADMPTAGVEDQVL